MATPCKRCGAPASVHMPDTPRCTACFELYLQRTFRTALGRSGGGGRRRVVAIGISGGECSAALSLLLRDYQLSLTAKPSDSVAARHMLLLHVRPSLSSPIPSCLSFLRDEILGSEVHVLDLEPDIDLDLTKDASDKLQFIAMRIQDTLSRAAKEHECETVLLGSSVTRMASDILTSVATARGNQTKPLASTVVIEPETNVRFIRPLGSVPIRHIVRYARMKIPLETVDFVWNKTPARTIQSVIERFVNAVGEDNASSVHNVVRTADRLNEVMNENARRCVICRHTIVDVDMIDSTHRQQEKKSKSCGDCACGQKKDKEEGQVNGDLNRNGNMNGHMHAIGNGVERKCDCNASVNCESDADCDHHSICVGCRRCLHRASPDASRRFVQRALQRREIEGYLL